MPANASDFLVFGRVANQSGSNVAKVVFSGSVSPTRLTASVDLDATEHSTVRLYWVAHEGKTFTYTVDRLAEAGIDRWITGSLNNVAGSTVVDVAGQDKLFFRFTNNVNTGSAGAIGLSLWVKPVIKGTPGLG